MTRPTLNLLSHERLSSERRMYLVRQMFEMSANGSAVSCGAGSHPADWRVDLFTEPGKPVDVQEWQSCLGSYPEFDAMQMRWHTDGTATDIGDSDLLVLLSSSLNAESTVAQALDKGIPVLVPDDVAREKVRDGINGFRFRGDDVHSLALSLLALLVRAQSGQVESRAASSEADTSERPGKSGAPQ